MAFNRINDTYFKGRGLSSTSAIHITIGVHFVISILANAQLWDFTSKYIQI